MQGIINFIGAAILAALVSPLSFAQTSPPPIEAYGKLEAISHVDISPSGERLAFLWREGGVNTVRVISTKDFSGVYIGKIGDIKARSVTWAGENHVILRVSKTTAIFGFQGKVDYSGAFALNLETQKITQLLKRARKIYPGQSGLGNIVGLREGTNEVFMPAYTQTNGNSPDFSLMIADLDDGSARIFNPGDRNIIDWFVDTDGTILAKEQYNNKNNLYRLATRRSGKWETVEEYKAEIRPNSVAGITPDRTGLVKIVRNKKGYNEARKLNFDGSYENLDMNRDNLEIVQVLTDSNRIVYGVGYGGLQPTYNFLDKKLAKDVADFQAKVPAASVRLASWSDGFKKIVFRVDGTGYAGDYFLVDRETGEITNVASSRPDIPKEVIGEVLTINYKAQDGLNIPGVMTVPNGSDIKNLPAIIMPHGGPEAHDQVSFDWMAQYFASRGYLVFQPNFRGSDGFGAEFTRAGYGGWGGVMQQDITDGVTALKNGGMIDPERVCIVGWSYGGYAALAGGAFTPDLYKCVAAIAPVTDLPLMLVDEKKQHGRNHWVVSYWEKAIAKGDADRAFLKERSPAAHAEHFKAPVLLIHGKDDLIVKINQSHRMKKALERADKDVKLIQMKRQDHGLSTRDARLDALKALDSFIAEHIGPHAQNG